MIRRKAFTKLAFPLDKVDFPNRGNSTPNKESEKENTEVRSDACIFYVRDKGISEGEKMLGKKPEVCNDLIPLRLYPHNSK